MSKRTYNTAEVLELVAEDGSKDELDIEFEHEDSSGEEDNEHSQDFDDDDDGRFQLLGDLQTDETQQDLDLTALMMLTLKLTWLTRLLSLPLISLMMI